MRLREDDGAVIVFFSLLLVALLIMTALVVDLGMARETKRRGQSDADFAAVCRRLVPGRQRKLGHGLQSAGGVQRSRQLDRDQRG